MVKVHEQPKYIDKEQRQQPFDTLLMEKDLQSTMIASSTASENDINVNRAGRDDSLNHSFTETTAGLSGFSERESESCSSAALVDVHIRS